MESDSAWGNIQQRDWNGLINFTFCSDRSPQTHIWCHLQLLKFDFSSWTKLPPYDIMSIVIGRIVSCVISNQIQFNLPFPQIDLMIYAHSKRVGTTFNGFLEIKCRAWCEVPMGWSASFSKRPASEEGTCPDEMMRPRSILRIFSFLRYVRAVPRLCINSLVLKCVGYSSKTGAAISFTEKVSS